MVAKALRGLGFPDADRRLREGRTDDQGDIDGVPYTTIQVKYVAQPRLQTWITGTLKQRDAAGNPLCLLVVRVKQKRADSWDTWMPVGQILDEQIFGEGSVNGWVRTNLYLAAAILRRKIATLDGLSVPSSSTTWTALKPAITDPRAFSSAPSTGKVTPPSRTT